MFPLRTDIVPCPPMRCTLFSVSSSCQIQPGNKHILLSTRQHLTGIVQLVWVPNRSMRTVSGVPIVIWPFALRILIWILVVTTGQIKQRHHWRTLRRIQASKSCEIFSTDGYEKNPNNTLYYRGRTGPAGFQKAPVPFGMRYVCSMHGHIWLFAGQECLQEVSVPNILMATRTVTSTGVQVAHTVFENTHKLHIERTFIHISNSNSDGDSTIHHNEQQINTLLRVAQQTTGISLCVLRTARRINQRSSHKKYISKILEM